jgi:hypothetical protein
MTPAHVLLTYPRTLASHCVSQIVTPAPVPLTPLLTHSNFTKQIFNNDSVLLPLYRMRHLDAASLRALFLQRSAELMLRLKTELNKCMADGRSVLIHGSMLHPGVCNRILRGLDARGVGVLFVLQATESEHKRYAHNCLMTAHVPLKV